LTALSSFVSCGSGVVLGIPASEVLEKLKNQNIDFLLEADIDKIAEIKKLHSSAPFYVGLLLNDAGDSLRAERLFEAALESSSPQVRRASAEQLLPLLVKKNADSSLLRRIERLGSGENFKTDAPIQTLRNASLYILGRLGEIQVPKTDDFPSWNQGFSLLANLHLNKNIDDNDKQAVRDYFLKGTMNPAKAWAFEKLQAISPTWITSAEISAIEGRIAVSRSSFNEGINQFNAVIEENQALFFTSIDLLHDLGRAYQFTSYQQEGIDRFSEWETWLRTGSEMGTSLLTINITENRYRLLYFIGRIEQAQENYSKSIASFAEALNWTTDTAQQDACIWYILNAVLLENPAEIITYLQEYSSKWNDDVYFADIMDRVSQYLTSSGNWEGLLDVFNLNYGEKGRKDWETHAKYAYIIARAIQEGFISLEKLSETFMFDTSIAKDTVESAAKSFFNLAFAWSGQSFYYKALSSSFLGEEFNFLGQTEHPSIGGQESFNEDNFEFILRFFNYGAEHFAYSYFRNIPLNIEEQRIVAENFIETEHWYDAIRVASVYMNRGDYEVQLEDLELLYPRAYTDLIETYAAENNIPAEIFFGLVRTESAFNENAASWAGAYGLSQLMPDTAMDMARRMSRSGGPNYIEDGEIDILNPEINVHIGAWYLNYLVDYTGSPALALVAYNGGMGRVRRWRAEKPDLPEDLFLETIPYAETRDYGRRVLGAAAAYGYLYYNLSMEAVVADIFKSGE
jgi:soluble lytic murein transglycosylase